MINRFLNLLIIIFLFVPLTSQARFLGMDTAEGTPNNPPSLHKYLYAYGNPTVYVDPNGRTAEQFQSLMTASIESYKRSGNRTALGTAGELQLEKVLKANGEVIIKGPSISPEQHNADIISYNPETKKISFFDNKIQTKKSMVSRANNLSSDVGRLKSIESAHSLLRKLKIDPMMRKEIRQSLTQVKNNPSDAIWAVSNASPDELTKVDNKVKRVAKNLVEKGVLLADVTGNKINILTPEQSLSNGRKIAKKFAKALPILGTVAGTADAALRIDAAIREDNAYRNSMRKLGISSTKFDNHSIQREAAIWAGEETGGNSGAVAGAAAIAPFSPACGIAAPLCIVGGAIVGGFTGDNAGGSIGATVFDETARRMAPNEMKRIKQQIRAKQSQTLTGIVMENSSGRNTEVIKHW